MRGWEVVGLLFLSFGWCSSDETSDQLMVSWAAPGTQTKYSYNHLPRTVADATKQKWVKSGDGCATNKYFKGKRYILNMNDVYDTHSAMLIFDGKGHVAGIQTTLPKHIADKNSVADYGSLDASQIERFDDVDFLVLTAYFMDPDKICDGRTLDQFKKQGTIDKLYIQNGTGVYLPFDTVENNKLLLSKDWVPLEKCVPTMGTHYFFGFYDCPTWFPWFLMYDRLSNGKLVGFGVETWGHYPSNRYEYPPDYDFNGMMKPVPPCMKEAFDKANGTTSFHMYIIPEPLKIAC